MTECDQMDEFDRDEELRALLRSADPAVSLPSVDTRALAVLLAELARDEADPQSARHRGPLTWLVGAAAAAVVVTAGVGAISRLGDDHDAPTAGRHTTTTSPGARHTAAPADPSTSAAAVTSRLSLAAGALEARCAAPTAAMLAATDTAFSGTVTQIDGNQVTLQRTSTFQGSVADAVTITAPSAEFGRLVQAVHFEVGKTYLVSAYQGHLAVCGFSGPAKSDLQQLYTEAFPR